VVVEDLEVKVGLEALVDQVEEVVYIVLPKGVEMFRLLILLKVMMVEHNPVLLQHQLLVVTLLVVEELQQQAVVFQQVKLEVLERLI
tara:strand:- start:341 stop:601 length:261 start_codon:yes stop_codon:yes gene_type:complete